MTAEKPSEVAWKAAQCLGNCDDFRCCADSPDWAAEIIDREAVAPAVRDSHEVMRELLGLVELRYGNLDPLANDTVLKAREWFEKYRYLIEGEGE